MEIVTKIAGFSTKGSCDITDITPVLQEFLAETGLKNGQIHCFVKGSTAAITSIEYEPGLLRDIPEFWDSIIPRNRSYHHDNTWHDGNGHSHLRAAVQGAGFTVPVHNGDLFWGTWQQVVLIDFDNRPRKREVLFQAVGER